MGGSANRAALEGARGEIGSIAAEFSRAARGMVEAALHRRFDALLEARWEWFQALRPELVSALRDAADRAISQAADDVGRRLADEALWLSPQVVPGGVAHPQPGWSDLVPAWVSGLLRGLARRASPNALGGIDEPGNRAWIALTSAAKPLDPVLAEFGLPPSEIPDPGGGHYGLAPRTIAQLDPSGTLDRMWKRYRLTYRRYAALLGATG